MFDKLIVSTAQRRKGRTAKFFVCTSIIYLSAVVVAFGLSILLATPKLADTAPAVPLPIFIHSSGPTQRPNTIIDKSTVAPTNDPRNVQPLEDIVANLGNSRAPVNQNSSPPGTSTINALDGPVGGEPGIPGLPFSTGRDPIAGNVITDPPKPDPPKPQTRADNGKPLPVSSVVLQGKAVERVVPVYPELPRRIRLQGEVSLEVIISAEGRVESVRVVSGHPMLINSARDAARGWRFEPTFLNGVAVRVTGVITFVFKLSE